MKNSEGYDDPTANKAIGHINHAEKTKNKERAELAISSARQVLKNAGFELLHIAVRNIKTVQIYHSK